MIKLQCFPRILAVARAHFNETLARAELMKPSDSHSLKDKRQNRFIFDTQIEWAFACELALPCVRKSASTSAKSLWKFHYFK